MVLQRMTLEKQCDLAFVTSDAKRSQLEYLLLQNENPVLIASKSAPISKRFADGCEIDLADAADERFISMSSGHSIRILQDLLFKQHAISPEILLETCNLETARRLTSKTDAVFILPDSFLSLFADEQFPVNIYHIRSSGITHPFYACFPKNTELTPYAKAMVRLICLHLSVPCPLDT
jgi:DNA-binding transcriptional LysR family regulator